jgi:hypothetical protein
MKPVFAVLAAVVIALPAHAADNDAMTKAAAGFYAVYATFHPSDGIPDAQGRARYAPHMSDRLNNLLAQASAAEEKFARANKDTPPLVEGDMFTTNFEGATSYKVGDCAGDGKTGHCAIALTYDPRVQGDTQNKPMHWTDTAHLVNTPSGWKLDDIAFGGNWDFGNKGHMSDALKMVLATGGGGNN